MLFRILLWTLILGMVFRFITRFVLPIMHITGNVSNNLKKMQDEMNRQNEQNTASGQKSNPKPIEGEYIDYEEVK